MAAGLPCRRQRGELQKQRQLNTSLQTGTHRQLLTDGLGVGHGCFKTFSTPLIKSDMAQQSVLAELFGFLRDSSPQVRRIALANLLYVALRRLREVLSA